jgi:hypothetical protein
MLSLDVPIIPLRKALECSYVTIRLHQSVYLSPLGSEVMFDGNDANVIFKK